MSNTEDNRLRFLIMGDPNGKTALERDGRLKNTGLSVEKLARRIGVTRAAVYSYLTDRHRPSAENLKKLCEALGIDPGEGRKFCTPREEGRPAHRTTR